MPSARAIDTVSELSGSYASELPPHEAKAEAMVKTGRFTLDAVLEVLRMSEIPLSSKRSNVLPVGASEVRSLLLGLYCHGHQYGVTGATRK